MKHLKNPHKVGTYTSIKNNNNHTTQNSMRNSVQIVARKPSAQVKRMTNRASLELASKSRTDREKAQATAAMARQYSNDYIEHDSMELKRSIFNKSSGGHQNDYDGGKMAHKQYLAHEPLPNIETVQKKNN